MNKKGFTLIELLAVIIILAIVALIATPMVLNVIDDAKKSAAKSEANMIVSGINNWCAASEMKHHMDGTVDICADGVTAEEVKTMVNMGKATIKPSSTLTYADKKVTHITVVSNGYDVVMTAGAWAEPVTHVD